MPVVNMKVLSELPLEEVKHIIYSLQELKHTNPLKAKSQ